jgi:hypothetical protein
MIVAVFHFQARDRTLFDEVIENSVRYGNYGLFAQGRKFSIGRGKLVAVNACPPYEERRQVVRRKEPEIRHHAKKEHVQQSIIW